MKAAMDESTNCSTTLRREIEELDGPRRVDSREVARTRSSLTKVFPELRQGEYDLWGIDHGLLGRVTICGGQVTELGGPGEPP